jgi:hypothetical protein
MANFATLADLLAGCAARVSPDACSKLFAASTPPIGSAPTDTLTAAQSIARAPWYQPERLFALLDLFYPVPPVKLDGQPRRPNLRVVPFMPYLTAAGIVRAARPCSTARVISGLASRRRLGQCLVHHLRRPFHCGVR